MSETALFSEHTRSQEPAEEAARVFDRMLWLNPSDNQGVRFLIDPVRTRAAWKDGRQKR